MKMAHHQNIVKFLGLEQLTDSPITRHAIIMEYCTNGTLQHLINANSNGLSSEEFFRVSKDLVSAVEYLIKMRIVHSDIKPDNVMISGCPDGTSIYKLGDFGAARQLKPHEKYSSLYGTFEYLHIDLFIQYHYKSLEIIPKVNEFDSTHDFWSLGVLLYELAVGVLPFEPAEGRDVKIMYTMLSGKKNGQIAAKQTETGIEWFDELPQSSNLAGDKRVVHLLAKLINVSVNQNNKKSIVSVTMYIKKCGVLNIVFFFK